MSLSEWISGHVFQAVHQHNLVYNTCWEDPRLDRIALALGRRIPYWSLHRQAATRWTMPWRARAA